MKLRVCLEINGLAEDEFGNKCPAGVQISLGETDKQIDYNELTKNINIEGLLKTMCLDEVVCPEDVKIITPEEYDREYGEDET